MKKSTAPTLGVTRCELSSNARASLRARRFGGDLRRVRTIEDVREVWGIGVGRNATLLTDMTQWRRASPGGSLPGKRNHNCCAVRAGCVIRAPQQAEANPDCAHTQLPRKHCGPIAPLGVPARSFHVVDIATSSQRATASARQRLAWRRGESKNFQSSFFHCDDGRCCDAAAHWAGRRGLVDDGRLSPTQDTVLCGHDAHDFACLMHGKPYEVLLMRTVGSQRRADQR
jgi:hypothetical protein